MRYAKCDANPVRFVSAASDHHLLVLRVLDNLLLARNLLIRSNTELSVVRPFLICTSHNRSSQRIAKIR